MSNLLTNKNGLESNTNEDDVCDSWEQLDSQALERQVQANKLEKKPSEIIGSMMSSNITPVPQRHLEQNQPIKILKRPSVGNHLNNQTQVTQTASATQQMKSFEQREAEYAQARLRILGSARPAPEVMPLDETAASTLAEPKITFIREPKQPDGTKGFAAQHRQSTS